VIGVDRRVNLPVVGEVSPEEVINELVKLGLPIEEARRLLEEGEV
jgi:hypothetical protein